MAAAGMHPPVPDCLAALSSDVPHTIVASVTA
jgi:hypothetical protein